MMVPVVSILEIIYHIVTFKMAKMLFLFLFFVVTNWVKRSNICGLALCQKKKSKMQFIFFLEWVIEWKWMKYCGWEDNRWPLYIMCALYNLCQTFLLLLQKFQKIDEEHLKVIIGYLEKYIESQKKGQVLVEGVIIFVLFSISVCWC